VFVKERIILVFKGILKKYGACGGGAD